MKYVSSRNSKLQESPSMALIKGLADDGGLYTPLLNQRKLDLNELKDLTFQELSSKIVSFFIDDLTKEEIEECVSKAYDDKFDTKQITPLCDASDYHILELWHGPTSAFKDVALTLLPHLLSAAYRKNDYDKTLSILTATSGDTGKAALASFADVKNTAITVFYPEIGVSDIQKLQMATSKGNNVAVMAVKGNFDDCQRMVKEAYSNEKLLEGLDHVCLSSANSINIGRLVPQIVYYYYAYFELIRNNEINMNDQINFCVPTGNFGDILAGYLAKESGLPIKKLICASNRNNILSDFINTGRYDLDRNFYPTMSPSMDILISSNLERLLFLLSEDASYVSSLMKKLQEERFYEVDETMIKKLQDSFSAYWTSEEECKETIRKVFEEKKILIDPHTAVAVSAYEKYRKESEDDTKAVVLSTASPYKFASDVLNSLGYEEKEPFEAMKKLNSISGLSIPKNLAELKEMPIRFDSSIAIEEGMDYIAKRLKEINDAEY